IVRADPAVSNIVGFTGGGQTNSGNMYIGLKPISERKPIDQVIARLRKKLSHEPGAKLRLQAQQDVRVGGRFSQAEYQYTLQADNLKDLRIWAPRLYRAMQQIPILADVNTDQQDAGLETYITYDRDTMARVGITPNEADQTLNDAFGQRQVSTIYNPLNQYHVVMEISPKYLENTDSLKSTYVMAPGGAVPLPAVTSYGPANTPLAVNHQGQFAATTISFNLPPGVSLGQAADAINETFTRLGVPDTVHGSFQGTARAFEESLASLGWLLFAAVLTIYIVLGMLYESYVHPLTILFSSLFPAGVGALLALKLFHINLDLISGIGILLLIGIVKKNAIMMIDFAIETERSEGLRPREAIYKACLMRFRPIMMTTMAALFGMLPLALGRGDGAEIRVPLGVAIVGGLMVSQVLTLYTTPVVYLYLDRFRLWVLGRPRHAEGFAS
ncbi:MAG: efflux RND transporter permease subunit, partial [Pseudomonadota bacterium]|nr:efflux RND transporter permease subunit [Pseudomonadota bacterium]